MNKDSLIQGRAAVLCTRMRFSSQAQPSKQAAIDRILEQNLLLVDEGESLSAQEIESRGIICFVDDTPIITRLELEQSLKRLKDGGKVEALETGNTVRYSLSDAGSGKGVRTILLPCLISS